MKHVFTYLLSITVLLLPAVPVTAGAQVETVSDNGLIVTWTTPEFTSVTEMHGGIPYIRLSAPDCGVAGEPGAPQVPVTAEVVAVPPGKRAVVRLLFEDAVDLPDMLLAPAPASVSVIGADGSTTLEERVVPDAAQYAADRYWPDTIVGLGPQANRRGVLLQYISLCPFRYNPATRTLRLSRRLQFEVRFEDDPQSQAAGPIPFHPSAEFFDDVLNRDQMMRWPAPALQKPAPVQTPGAVDVRNYILRIGVINDGLYKITYNDLVALGVPLETLDPRTFRMATGDREIPIVVRGEADGRFDPSDVILFFGEQLHREDGKWFHRFAKENAYLLGWGGVNGLRYQEQNGAPTGMPLADYFLAFEHLEVDSLYHDGGVITISQLSTYDATEDWYWQQFRASLEAVVQHRVQHLAVTSESSRVRFELKAIAAELNTHNMSVYVNSHKIHDVTSAWQGISYYSTIVDVPMSHWIEGQDNTLRFTNNYPDGIRDVLHLEWIELEIWKQFVARNNVLDFRPAHNGGQRYVLKGFTGSDVEIWDVTSGIRFTNAAMAQESGTWTVTFEDNRPAGARRYWAAGAGAFRAPSSLRRLQVSVDLKSSLNRADYIIVTHPDFMEAATWLANYRVQHNAPLDTMVVTTEQIYDQFAQGLFTPVAIRDFIRHALQQWQDPRPVYLVLLGDASWNYFDNAGAAYTNYVPSYGFPPADNYFVSLTDTPPRLPAMHVSRIPAITNDEALAYIGKLVDYEKAGEPESWHKSALFLSGGLDTPERPNDRADNLIKVTDLRNYIAGPPNGMDATIVKKTVNVSVDPSRAEEIRTYINAGQSWITIFGHGSAIVHDLDFGRARSLDNTGRYPFMFILSCKTGEFAKPEAGDRSLSEDFLLEPSRGAVGYFSTSGWSYKYKNNVIASKLFDAVFRDKQRDMGPATTTAKQALWAEYSFEISQSPAAADEVQIHIDQYTLFGDPLLRYKLPALPDMAVANGDIALSVPNPAESQGTVQINVTIRNLGLTPGTPVAVRVFDRPEIGQETLVDGATASLNAFESTVSIPWDISDAGGDHTLRVEVDPDNLVAEASETNNSVSQSVRILISSINPLSPFTYEEIPPDRVRLRAFVKAQPAAAESLRRTVTVQVDTSTLFTAPLFNRTGIALGPAGADVTVPGLLTDRRYYWRVQTVDEQNPAGNWAVSQFRTGQASQPGRRWTQAGIQLQDAEILNGTVTSAGVETMPVIAPVLAFSAGDMAGSASDIRVNDVSVTVTPHDTLMPGDALLWGFRAVALEPATYAVTEGWFFRTYHFTSESEALAQWIAALPAGTPVIVAAAHDATAQLTAQARDALKTLGAGQIDALATGDSYVLIGRKGAAPGSVPEQLVPRSANPAQLSHTLEGSYQKVSILSLVISGAARWNEAAIHAGGADNPVTVTVEGQHSASVVWDSLAIFEVRPPGGTVTHALNQIDAVQYPHLRLRAHIAGSADGPTRLERWSVTYETLPELMITNESVATGIDTVFTSAPLPLALTVFNLGDMPADSVTLDIHNIGTAGGAPLAALTIPRIPPDSSVVMTPVIAPLGLPEQAVLSVSVNAGARIAEGTYKNNQAYLQFAVNQDVAGPRIEVSFDGRGVMPGDYVSTTPLIQVKILDNNAGSIQDTGSVQVLLDGRIIPYGNNSELEFVPLTGEGDLRAEVLYRPALTGDHALAVIATDAGGNTTRYDIEVRTDDHLALREVYNYPNPFAGPTEFLYYLTQDADDVRAYIYTVAGRRIRELRNLPNMLGFNTYTWDGLDEDGDRPAAGTYFCRLVARGSDGEASHTLKMVVMPR